MRLREQIIGALNLFGSTGSLFDQTEVRVVQALADVATIALIQERTIRRVEALTEQLQFALNSRILIEQAKGAVAMLAGVTTEQAFELLRGWASDTSRCAWSMWRKRCSRNSEARDELWLWDPPSGPDDSDLRGHERCR